jgi:hypothetical protein
MANYIKSEKIKLKTFGCILNKNCFDFGQAESWETKIRKITGAGLLITQSISYLT